MPILENSLEIYYKNQNILVFHLQNKCKKTVKSLNWSAFYWVLVSSILINWPIIRWLDDRQWYKEWIRVEDKE